MYTQVKTAAEISAMREAGGMLATVLAVLAKQAAPGMSTKELADIAARELKGLGGKPSFLGYQGFPDVICISVNDEVVHGIPKPDKIIREGDIVGLDFGVTIDKMVTDSAISLIVGQPCSKREALLVSTTKQAMEAGIAVLKDGVRVGDIAAAVQKVLEAHDFGIVRDLVGHGVGHYLHEDPNIPNYGSKGSGPILKSGMTICIEPMSTLGGHDVYVDDDQWTIRTQDGTRSAHFEHTILITDDGYDVLTQI